MSQCTECAEDLTDEEITAPHHDDDGQVICDRCYDDNYCDQCQRCMNIVEKSELESKPGELIAVWRNSPGAPSDLPLGYYKVMRWPFFADGMIHGNFYSDSLLRVADLDGHGNRAAEESFYLSGPICAHCRNKIIAANPESGTPQP